MPDDKIGIYAHAFMPKESVYQHNKTDKLPYEAYKEQGFISFIDGELIDNVDLKEYLCDFEQKNNLEIRAISADKAWCYQLLIDFELGRTPTGKAYTTLECPQTTAVLNEPTDMFRNKLVSNKLVICYNKLFANHCANAYVEYDKGSRQKVAKKNKDSPFRIDMLAATLNALRKIDLLESENLTNALMTGQFTF